MTSKGIMLQTPHSLHQSISVRQAPTTTSPTLILEQKSHNLYMDNGPDHRSWIYHLKSIWLFTFSDLKTIVGPKTAFGILNALGASAYGINPSTRAMPGIVLVTAFWTWINLLPFTIDNQRQPATILEDEVNKPWRTMPSRRLTPEQAKRLMFALYPVAFLASVSFGGLWQCLILMLLGYWYNDRGGAADCVTRNFINACGFVCYASGAMEVALGTDLPFKIPLLQWFLVISGVVFSTVQTQDLYDQAGDRLCGRKTLPILVGDGPSRWMTAFPMLSWSLFCPWYWSLPLDVSAAFLGLGIVTVGRMMLKREVADDQRTFKIWNAWMVFLYLLPLIKYIRHS